MIEDYKIKNYKNIPFYDINTNFIWNTQKNYMVAICIAYERTHIFFSPEDPNGHLCTFLALLENVNLPRDIKYYFVRTLICPPIEYRNAVNYIVNTIDDEVKEELIIKQQESAPIIDKAFKIGALKEEAPESYGISYSDIDKYRKILPSEKLADLFYSHKFNLNYFADLSNKCWEEMSKSSVFLDEDSENKDLVGVSKKLEDKK